MLIRINPPFISGIWSLALTSTMTRLRLQRVATESSCPTKTITEGEKRCSKGQNRDSQGQDRDSQGQDSDNQGQNRDNQGQNRDSRGQNRDRGKIGQTPTDSHTSHDSMFRSSKCFKEARTKTVLSSHCTYHMFLHIIKA